MAKSEIVWRGEKGLRRLLVPVSDLTPHPRNPRLGSLDAIQASLERFGQLRPILVNPRTGFIVAGNHTYRAAVERLGWNRIARVEADLDGEEEAAYLVADNRTSDLGSYDQDALLSILSPLAEAGRILGTGYDPDDVDDMVAEQAKIAETAREEFQGGHSESPEELARREGLRRESITVREVVLPFTEEQHEKFAAHVKMLKKEWGLTGVTETVARAVEEAARAL